MIVPHITVEYNNQKVKAYVDTGATVTLISDVISANKVKGLKPYEGHVLDASGNSIPILGQATALVETPAGSFNTSVLIFKKNIF